MPTFTFKCKECDYEQDVFFKFADYKEEIQCPECGGVFCRVWDGYGQAPGIKTVTRIEDIWKKRGLLDPEDPDYNKVNQQRIKDMREKDKKRKEKIIDRMADKKKVKEYKERTRKYKPTDKPGERLSDKEVSREMKKE